MNDWWSRKLGNTPQQPSAYTPPVRPPAPMPFNPSAMGPRTPVAYDQNTDQVTTRAQHIRNSSTCPDCGSGNYMMATPGGSKYTRCFDCGYPIMQTTSGLRGSTAEPGTPTQAAQQVSTANNFNPNVIVGHIG